MSSIVTEAAVLALYEPCLRNHHTRMVSTASKHHLFLTFVWMTRLLIMDVRAGDFFFINFSSFWGVDNNWLGKLLFVELSEYIVYSSLPKVTLDG